MSTHFIGRNNELKALGRLLDKRTASLAVVQVRRRVGKSPLIQKFALRKRFLHFSGIPPHAHTTIKSELQEFARQLSEQTTLPELYANDWSKLFILLEYCWHKASVAHVKAKKYLFSIFLQEYIQV